MKRYGIDLDGTLTIDNNGWDYANRTPNPDMIKIINGLYDEGHLITFFSSRFKIDRAVTTKWLKKYGVKYHELILGKPKFDVYVDDINITPENFMNDNERFLEDYG